MSNRVNQRLSVWRNSVMSETTSVIVRTSSCFQPILARFRSPFGRSVNDLKFLFSMGKLTFLTVGAVAASVHVRRTQLCFVKLGVGSRSPVFLSLLPIDRRRRWSSHWRTWIRRSSRGQQANGLFIFSFRSVVVENRTYNTRFKSRQWRS